MVTLESELNDLSSTLLARLQSRGFREEQLKVWASQIHEDVNVRNRVVGSVTAPKDDDVNTISMKESIRQELACVGREALTKGQVAMCVLAGGMATRMGGVVKAVVPVMGEQTFLDLRLNENKTLRAKYHAEIPLWLMTSEATDATIRAALLQHNYDAQAFEQFVSLRLTPEGTLFWTSQHEPSIYATGHGDLPEALWHSGLLQQFLDRGGKYVFVANLDNLGATMDEVLLGYHITRKKPVTVEVCQKYPGDKGGGPVRVNDRCIILEEFRLPVDFDTSSVPVFNTNTFWFNAHELSTLSMPWTYVQVQKKVEGRDAIQFERLLGEITTGLESQFVLVPREGIQARFLPVKDTKELETRLSEIQAIAKSRGLSL